MFSRILRQPSQLEIAFQYLWKDLLLIPKQSQKLLIKEEEKTLPKAQNHPVIDFFGEPYYSKTKDHQKLSDESQEDDETGQNQKFPQVEIQMDKEAEATRLHIDENENIQQLDENERRETRRPAYPTKNFLPFFKPSFVSYLAKHFDEEYFNSIPIIEKMNIKKNAINLKDYQELLCFEEFRPILECYFAERQIYRFLMMSRIHTKNKLVYLKKIHVFERAFQKRVFAKIN